MKEEGKAGSEGREGVLGYRGQAGEVCWGRCAVVGTDGGHRWKEMVCNVG